MKGRPSRLLTEWCDRTEILQQNAAAVRLVETGGKNKIVLMQREHGEIGERIVEVAVARSTTCRLWGDIKASNGSNDANEGGDEMRGSNVH